MAGYIGSGVVSLSTTGADIDGNITVDGTVDGRDVSVDGTKLDGIEASSTADQTKADIEGLGIDVPAANLTGTVAAARLSTAATQAESDASTKIATTAYVSSKLTTLIGGAPSTLNDLNELAAAINDDANYNSTLTTALATKLPLAGGALTGAVTGTTASFTRLDINATNTKLKGDLLANSDGAFDIGASGASRPRNLYLSNSIVAGDITTTGVGTFGGNVKAKGYLASEATNSTSKWLAYTHTDNTFRFNYNGAGNDEFIIEADGTQNITAPSGDGSPAVALTMSGGSAGFNWAHTDFQASLGSNCNLVNMFGISGTARNAGYIGFKRIGALGATTNILTLGLHSADNVLNINGNSNVGIGTTSPLAKLDISAGTASGTMYNALVLRGGQNSAQGSGVRLIMSGTENDPLARGSIIESIMTDNQNTHSLKFYTSVASTPTVKMTIGGNGNVGINKTAPNDKLHVANGWLRVQAADQTSGSHASKYGLRWTQETDAEVARIEVERPSWGGAPSRMNFYTRTPSNALNKNLAIDEYGRVTTPYQPSFHARRSAAYTGYAANGVDGSSLQIILYNVADYNTGSGFNPANGRFTAPVAGVYYFRAECYSTKTNWGQSWFVVNGSRRSGTDSVPPSAGAIVGNSAIIKLAAQDYVGFHPYANDSNQTVTAHVNHTWFRGILLG